jgi:hypothetical protein
MFALAGVLCPENSNRMMRETMPSDAGFLEAFLRNEYSVWENSTCCPVAQYLGKVDLLTVP